MTSWLRSPIAKLPTPSDLSKTGEAKMSHRARQDKVVSFFASHSGTLGQDIDFPEHQS